VTVNLFGPKPEHSRARTTQIKAWAVEALGLSDDIAVMVTELRCTEPGCPPLETVIAVLSQSVQPRQYKIHKALAEVTHADIRTLGLRASAEV